jgi:hypothetical protein
LCLDGDRAPPRRASERLSSSVASTSETSAATASWKVTGAACTSATETGQARTAQSQPPGPVIPPSFENPA